MNLAVQKPFPTFLEAYNKSNGFIIQQYVDRGRRELVQGIMDLSGDKQQKDGRDGCRQRKERQETFLMLVARPHLMMAT